LARRVDRGLRCWMLGGKNGCYVACRRHVQLLLKSAELGTSALSSY